METGLFLSPKTYNPSRATDDNVDVENGGRSYNRLLEVGPEAPQEGPRPRNCCLRLVRDTANFAARTFLSRLRNWSDPSQLSDEEKVIMAAGMCAQQRRSAGCGNIRRRQEVQPPTSVFGLSMIDAAKTLLGWGVAIGLCCLCVYIFVQYQAALSMTQITSSDRYTDSSESSKQLSRELQERTERPKQSGKCVLPSFPEHGIFIISDAPNATPGQTFDALRLTMNCSAGYRALGPEIVFCVNGKWSHSIPKCIRVCKLNTHPSVLYQCRASGSTRYRSCNTYEPSGTVVKPECIRPIYYTVGPLQYMNCVDGSWDRVVECNAECGLTINSRALISGGKPAKRGEVPWFVGIYRKTSIPYEQICGGSLISNRAVISAAHCFWTDIGKKQSASMYTAAVGKVYRPWNNPRDLQAGAQRSNVKEIKIPPRFRGGSMNFQDDIAVVILEAAFDYTMYVSPVCLNFNRDLDKNQLQPGNFGKVAGWGLTSENGYASPILKVVELPYVDINECIIKASPLFISSDKICAGYGNGTSLCDGDSGGGLVFSSSERGIVRNFLRGIVSTAAKNNDACNTHSITTFTHIYKHKDFIEESLLGVT